MTPPLLPDLEVRATTPVGGVDRRHWCLGALSWAGLAGCATVTIGPSGATGGLHGVAPFSTARWLGTPPEGWREQIMRHDLPATRYELVERDQRRVLHAVAEGSSSGLRCDVDIDPQRQPWLSWDWRVDCVDPEATVAADELDDSPARILIAFDGDTDSLTLRDRLIKEQVELFTGYSLPFATLTYVWDGQAAPESVFPYPRTSRIRYLVVEGGAAHTGRWQHYQRNVVNDYRRVFGGEPGRILSVGVMTDSDDLKSRAEAWFGDLAFSASSG